MKLPEIIKFIWDYIFKNTKSLPALYVYSLYKVMQKLFSPLPSHKFSKIMKDAVIYERPLPLSIILKYSEMISVLIKN